MNETPVLQAGQSSVTAAVEITGQASADTTTVITLTSNALPSGWSIDTARNTYTINWIDDFIDAAFFADGTSSAAEGDSALSLTIRLSRDAPVGGVTVQVVTFSDDVSFAGGSNSSSPRSVDVLIAEGGRMGVFMVEINDDSIREDEEEVVLSLDSVVGPTGWELLDNRSEHVLTIAASD